MDLKTTMSSDLELQLQIPAHTQEWLHNMLEKSLIFNKMRSRRKEGQGNDLIPSNDAKLRCKHRTNLDCGTWTDLCISPFSHLSL
uniref:Uncharacterized protein n=1 Tax=Lactuca sativa TaxID=4236 RepID=A0A9R1V4U2_LACSA|nr:hypothetical protein LSAT_V11C600341720 [Lactuca sativa]